MMQKSRIEILGATDGDVKEIAALEKACFSSPWSESALRETMAGETAVFLVAKIEGKVCGYIGAYYVMDEGYITNVTVSPAYRRRGVGRALIKELISRAEDLKLSFLTLEVRVSNLAAIALYSSLGFSKVGERPRFYKDPEESASLMTYYTGKENRL